MVTWDSTNQPKGQRKTRAAAAEEETGGQEESCRCLAPLVLALSPGQPPGGAAWRVRQAPPPALTSLCSSSSLCAALICCPYYVCTGVLLKTADGKGDIVHYNSGQKSQPTTASAPCLSRVPGLEVLIPVTRHRRHYPTKIAQDWNLLKRNWDIRLEFSGMKITLPLIGHRKIMAFWFKASCCSQGSLSLCSPGCLSLCVLLAHHALCQLQNTVFLHTGCIS